MKCWQSRPSRGRSAGEILSHDVFDFENGGSENQNGKELTSPTETPTPVSPDHEMCKSSKTLWYLQASFHRRLVPRQQSLTVYPCSTFQETRDPQSPPLASHPRGHRDRKKRAGVDFFAKAASVGLSNLHNQELVWIWQYDIIHVSAIKRPTLLMVSYARVSRPLPSNEGCRIPIALFEGFWVGVS